MKVNEILDPKMLMKRPRKAVLMKSGKPMHQIQGNRAKSFCHFMATAS